MRTKAMERKAAVPPQAESVMVVQSATTNRALHKLDQSALEQRLAQESWRLFRSAPQAADMANWWLVYTHASEMMSAPLTCTPCYR